MKCYTTQKNRTVPSTPYRIHTWQCFLCTMMVLVLSACSESKTENSSGNADDSKTARVTFTTNGGISPIPKQTVNTGTKATRPDDPTRSGHEFGGWYTDDKIFKVSFNFNDPIIQDITLYAKWRQAEADKYTVSFHMDGDTPQISKQTVDTGTKTTRPDDPTRSGHVFGGWYTDNTSFRNAFSFSAAITKDTSLYAKWIARYTVSFESNSGNAVVSQTVDTGTKITEPTAPARSGYRFDRWYTDDNTFKGPFEFNAPIIRDITLYAKWIIKAYTVTFVTNGGDRLAPIQVRENGTLSPQSTTRDGFIFGGWYTDDKIFKVSFNFNDPIIQDITLYAKWRQAEADKYTVSFRMNGGLPVISAQEISKSATATRPGDPTRSGHKFGGWYTDAKIFKVSFNFNDPIIEHITLYAKWSIVTYTVSFHMNEGTPQISKQTVDMGTKAIDPDDPKRSGYRFDEWYTDNTFDTKFDFSSAVTDDITLYAKWIARYTVSFESNSGNVVVSQTVDTGTKAIKPTAPTRGGYIFNEWYTDNTFDTQFDFRSAITEDTILYAKWDAIISLAGIITRETIPQDLRPYNEIVRTILAPYESGAGIVARYVTVAGAGSGDGSAWKHAKVGTDLRTTLQGIVDAAENKVYLLLIGGGEYKVGDTLAMKNHVAIVGGWDSNEDWARAADTHTILSGDDARRVFNNNGLDHTALLYGVEITKGKSNDNGGGMYNGSSSPVLVNVTFSGNTATNSGGGMYNDSSSPVLVNVTFSGNRARGGGGMYNGSSSPVLVNVTFSGNRAGLGGGGMFNGSSSPTIVNAVFWGNTAPTGPQILAYTGGTITFAYSVIDKVATTTNGIVLAVGIGKLPGAVVIAPEYTNPSLGDLANNGGSVSTHAIPSASSAVNIGLYVRRQGSTFYYSTDKITWYTGFGSSGSGLATPANLPSDAIDLTATDATGHKRTGRPDAGAHEAR